MFSSLSEVLAVASIATGGIIWLAVLHARISLASRDAGDVREALGSHEDLCSERYGNIERQNVDLRAWMVRLESKIDVLMTK